MPFGVLAGLAAGLASSLAYTKSKPAALLIGLACIIYSPLQFMRGGVAGAVAGGAVYLILGGFWALAPAVLRRRIAVSKLCEGDIPYSSVYLSKGALQYWSPPTVPELLALALKLDSKALTKLGPPPTRLQARWMPAA